MTDICPVLRSTQIQMILGGSNPLIDWFRSFLSKLYVIEIDTYHTQGGEYIFYILTTEGHKQWVFLYDKYANEFWFNYVFFEPILSLYNVKNNSYNMAIKLMVDDWFKDSERNLPFPEDAYGFNMIENVLLYNTIDGIPAKDMIILI